MDRETSTFRSMVIKIPEVILVHVQGKIVFANDYAAGVFGVSAEAITGHMIYEYVTEEYREVVKKNLTAQENREITPEFSIDIVTLDQRIRTVAVRSASIIWEGLPGTVFTLNDITDKKKVEQMLSVSEERWKFALEGSNLGVWDWNVQTGEIYFSPKWKQILGYEEDELANEYSTWEQRLHPEERDEVIDYLYAQIRGKNLIYENEYRMLTKEGSYKWILDRGRIMSWTEDGMPLRFTGVHIDITEKKESEERLRKVNEELDNFFDVNLDLLCIANTMGYFTRLNNEWMNTLGYTKEELMEHQFLDFVHPEDMQITLDAISELQQQIKIINFVNRYRCKDGTYKWLEWRSYPVGEKIYAAARDITDHKIIEKELTEKDNILSAVTKSLNILLTENDFTKAISECFQEVGRSIDVDRIYIFENSIDPETGKHCSSQKVEWNNIQDAVPQIDNPDLQMIPYEILVEFEEACQRKEMFFGHVRNFTGILHDILAEQNILSILIIPIFINDYFWGYVGFDECGEERDWTEIEKTILQVFAVSIANAIRRMQSNKELEAAKTAAETASLAKGQFLANMSHEIRTPINGILGIVELLSETNATPEQEQYLDILKMSTESLLKVINDILDISKIEYGKMVITPEPFELDDRVCDTLRSVATPIFDKGIELYYEIDPDIPNNLLGDFDKLRQILINLLNNAMKFTAQGEISVSVEPISITEDNVILKFIVKDTGIGIQEDMLKIIFEPFTQADGTISRKYGGTGLGLSICSKLVQLMKGDIWAESAVGDGTSVIFTVPLDINKDEYRIKQHAYPVIVNKRILMVGNNAYRSEIVRRVLIYQGAVANVITNSSNALAEILLKADGLRAYDAILIDTGLPYNEAFSLYDQLQSYPKLRRILLISSASKNSDLRRCIDKKIRDYIIKPIKRSELLNAIVGKIDKKSDLQEKAPVNCRTHLHVLVAEDNEVNQLLTSRALEKIGHSYKMAANGKEAVELYNQESFDLILMDVQMPEMDGYTATAIIRDKEQTNGRHIPIVALTAHAMQGDEEKSLEAGMDYHLTKPLYSDKLSDMLDRLFPTEQVEVSTADKEVKEVINCRDERYTEVMISEVLDKLDQDKDFLSNVVTIFEDNSSKLLQSIREATQGRNGEELRKSAHSLKGAIAFFDSRNIYELALSLENAGKEEEFTKAAQLTEHLEKETQGIINIFRQYLSCKN